MLGGRWRFLEVFGTVTSTRWAGYDTWEPLANLASGAKQMVNAFNAKLRAAVAGGAASASAQ